MYTRVPGLYPRPAYPLREYARVNPGRRDSTGAGHRANGSAAELRSVDTWKMKSNYMYQRS